MNNTKKAIIINKDFYNLYSIEELKEDIKSTNEMLRQIYIKLGGLDNDILSEEEMCCIYNYVDILENCEVLEVRR